MVAHRVVWAASQLQTNVGDLVGRIAGNTSHNIIIMKPIESETGSDLLIWYSREVKINHYDPYNTSPRAPYTEDELEAEIIRRLGKFDSIGF